jgi:hypothetical protein
MLVNNDPETMLYYYTKTVENEKVLEGNGKYWSLNLDQTLKTLVVLYNFNFHEIAEKLQSLMPKNIEPLEEEIKRHWAFLHAARCLRIYVDEEYYTSMREKLPDSNIKLPNIKKISDSEEQDKKRLEKENDKYINERFNLISLNYEGINKNKDTKNDQKIDKNCDKNIEESFTMNTMNNVDSNANKNENHEIIKTEEDKFCKFLHPAGKKENLNCCTITNIPEKSENYNDKSPIICEDNIQSYSDFKILDQSMKEIEELFEKANKLKGEELTYISHKKELGKLVSNKLDKNENEIYCDVNQKEKMLEWDETNLFPISTRELRNGKINYNFLT